MIETNSLIKASAGTGKTFALATRFIRLMLFDRVNPAEIVALTFSRAAAQEIYEKILDRLAKAAENEDGAGKEWEILLEDYKSGDIPDSKERLRAIESNFIAHDVSVFRGLLRKLIDSQYLGTIATIDSFILRFYQNFPKEMGFQNTVEILDSIAEDDAIKEALHLALVRKTKDEDIASAFKVVSKGDFSRNCIDSILRVIKKEGWRDFVAAHPESKVWTVGSMCEALGVPSESNRPDLSGILDDSKETNKIKNWVSSDVGVDFAFGKNLTGSLLREIWANKNATTFTYANTDSDKSYTFTCDKKQADAIRDAIQYKLNCYLKHMIDKVVANIALVKAVDAVYYKATRRLGKLTFGDLIQNTLSGEFTSRKDAIRNVEFRFDTKFNHWALDEFQDTSELQWKRLRTFVEEVASAGYIGEDRSAMVVGDLKQSIYTWRGASATPFEEIEGFESFSGYIRSLERSFRYGPNIAEFVNKVFGAENISGSNSLLKTNFASAEEWRSLWGDHVSDRSGDYVKVIAAKSTTVAGGKDDVVLEALCGEVKNLWGVHESKNSNDTIAVLVRSNEKGVAVAEYLRSNGLPAVWEGNNSIINHPIVNAVLSLLKLADHPKDTAAWKIVSELYPVCEVVFPKLNSAAAVSAAVSRMLSRIGLARTLKDVCAKIEKSFSFAANSIATLRLKQLVEIGFEFESRSLYGIDSFRAYIEKSFRREDAASSQVIRILTIHRSKGLGFDHVFVPLFENRGSANSGINKPKVSSPLYSNDANLRWVLPHLKKDAVFLNPHTSKAYAEMCDKALLEALRTYYVAFTRSKKSMFVIFSEESCDNDESILMKDLISSCLKGVPSKDGVLYEKGDYPTCENKMSKSDSDKTRLAVDKWRESGKREFIERVSPSIFVSSMWHGTASPFSDNFGGSVRRGNAAHVKYENIEWIDASEAKNEFEQSLVKPEDGASVWREKSYELFIDGKWETGKFDRVVFTGGKENRMATIYDFKTNVVRGAESEAEFILRMQKAYASQMSAYKTALSHLTGIAVERIETKLLLESIGKAVSIS